MVKSEFCYRKSKPNYTPMSTISGHGQAKRGVYSGHGVAKRGVYSGHGVAKRGVYSGHGVAKRGVYSRKVYKEH